MVLFYLKVDREKVKVCEIWWFEWNNVIFLLMLILDVLDGKIILLMIIL